MNEARKKLLTMLLIIIFILGFTTSFIFINTLSTYMMVDEGEIYATEQLDEFLRLALNINKSFLTTIKAEWSEYISLGNNNINNFVTLAIEPLKESAYRSIIIVIYDKKQELIYNFIDYGDFNPNSHNLYPDELIIINDEDIVFGQGNRFFIEGIILSNERDEEFEIYIGFDEKIMYDNFIAVIEIDTIQEIKKRIINMLWSLGGLIIALIIIIVYIVYYAQCLPALLKTNIYEDIERYRKAINFIEKDKCE